MPYTTLNGEQDQTESLHESTLRFRRSLAPDTLEYRAVQEDARPDEIAQSDAQEILKAVFHVLQRSTV